MKIRKPLGVLVASVIVSLSALGGAAEGQSSRDVRCARAVMGSEPFDVVMARTEGPAGARPLIVEFVMRHSPETPAVSWRIDEELKQRGIGLPRISLDLDDYSELFDACRITVVPTYIALRIDEKHQGKIVDRLAGNDAGVDRVSRFIEALLDVR